MSADTRTINASLPGDRLADDLRRIVGDADELLKNIADATVDEFSTTREKFESRLNEARVKVDEARIALGRKAVHVADVSTEYIRENPWKMVGLLALTGLVGAVLVARRSRA